jgi:hypothetical protein
MIYSFAVSTPANTLEANRRKTPLKLTAGIIHQLDIVFPTGCAGFLYVALNNGLHQLWPTDNGEYFHTDGETISFKEFYKLNEAPFVLDVFTYNIDDTYAHSAIIRLGILQQSEIQGLWLPWSEEVFET